MIKRGVRTYKRDLRAVVRPGWESVARMAVGQALGTAAIGAHHVNIFAALLFGPRKNNLTAVGRNSRRVLRAGITGHGGEDEFGASSEISKVALKEKAEGAEDGQSRSQPRGVP
jgi:hypothetical protein